MTEGPRFFPNTLSVVSLADIQSQNFRVKIQGKVDHFLQRVYTSKELFKDYTIYEGVAGIAFMHTRLFEISGHQEHLKNAETFITAALESISTKKYLESGFIIGVAGVYGIAAVVFHLIGDDNLR